MALHPTPTRLGLLRDIRDGNVLGLPSATAVLSEGGRTRFVTDRTQEFYRAGWALPPDRAGGPWLLTDAGRAVLDADDRSRLAAEVSAEHFHLSPGDVRRIPKEN